MKLIIKLSIAIIVLYGCGSTKQINTDYDVKTDFNSFKTFMFLPWYSGNSEYVGEVAQSRLFEMIASQLVEKGYKQVDSGADLAVSLLVLLNEKREASAYTRYYYTGGYNYYFPFGYGVQSTTYIKKEDILEGTIIIDLFDEGSKTLVWQGVAIQEIVENQPQRKRQVESSIKKMFSEFPE